MPNKIWMSVILMMVFAVVPCRAGASDIPQSDACVEISPVGHVGTLYLGIKRTNGSCDVDLEKVGFYLNDATCMTEEPCGDNPNRGISCRYPSPQDVDCNDDDEEAIGPCIDFSDLEAMVNVICAPDNAACNECINWEMGSPNCTDFRTRSGVRVKNCSLRNGKSCHWKKCCKKKKKIAACGYPE